MAIEDLSDKDLRRIEPAAGSAAAIEARCDVRRLCAAERMTPTLALAFFRIADGDSKEAVTTDLGFSSRFQMERRMNALRRELQRSTLAA